MGAQAVREQARRGEAIVARPPLARGPLSLDLGLEAAVRRRWVCESLLGWAREQARIAREVLPEVYRPHERSVAYWSGVDAETRREAREDLT